MEKDEEKTVKLENDQEKNIGEIKEETQEEVRQTRKSRRDIWKKRQRMSVICSGRMKMEILLTV